MRVRKIIDTDIDIMLLGTFLESEADTLLQAGAIIPIGSLKKAAFLNERCCKLKTRAAVQLLVDTGMGRLGSLDDEALELFKNMRNFSHLKIIGVFSHLANANFPNDPYTLQQIEKFRKLRKTLLPLLSNQGIAADSFLFHILNSDGLHYYPEAAMNALRCGINLYGIYEMQKPGRLDLQPALSLKTKIAEIRKLPKGHAVGYEKEYRLTKNSYIATLPAGFADGIPFALSGLHRNKGIGYHVLLNGQAFPFVGRISMDYSNIDLGSSLEYLETLGIGQESEVVLIGQSQQREIRVEDWAAVKGSQSYDIVCSFGPRIKRILR